MTVESRWDMTTASRWRVKNQDERSISMLMWDMPIQWWTHNETSSPLMVKEGNFHEDKGEKSWSWAQWPPLTNLHQSFMIWGYNQRNCIMFFPVSPMSNTINVLTQNITSLNPCCVFPVFSSKLVAATLSYTSHSPLIHFTLLSPIQHR